MKTKNKRTRRKFTGEFKAKVAVEALKARETVNQISARHELHPHQVAQWKKQLQQEARLVFEGGASSGGGAVESREVELYEQIGRLKMELEVFKQSSECLSLESRRELVQAGPDLSVRRQCELLGLDRSGLCHAPLPERAENQKLMRLLDKEYARHPVYGVRRMTLFLRGLGHRADAKRVRRLLRLIGLEAVFPKPRLSIPDPVAGKYPYLLRGLKVERPDQVWCADITYIVSVR